MIRNETVHNGKDPKKSHNKGPDGNLYCMGCNLDL
jgi:hypothetical protein